MASLKMPVKMAHGVRENSELASRFRKTGSIGFESNLSVSEGNLSPIQTFEDDAQRKTPADGCSSEI